MHEQRLEYIKHPFAFLQRLPVVIADRLLACNNKIPVITGEAKACMLLPSRMADQSRLIGFFGATPESLLDSVGRGYSDLCAALCAISLSAIELQIWKEVDGVFSADPSKIPSARLLATVTSEEAGELTYYGSEVSLLHQ